MVLSNTNEGANPQVCHIVSAQRRFYGIMIANLSVLRFGRLC